MCFIFKFWQCLTLCIGQSKRLIIAGCKIKWLYSDIISCSWRIWENLAKSPKYRIVQGLSQIFSDTSKNTIFSFLCFFVKIWQCLALCSGQSKGLIIAGCKIIWLCLDIILCLWSIRENLAKSLNYLILRGLSQIFSDSS